jgi:hypothetical protein
MFYEIKCRFNSPLFWGGIEAAFDPKKPDDSW